jgi:hypothetical protein
MYKNHVPAKWADQVPGVVRNAQGIDEWVFQGERHHAVRHGRTVGWREEWGFNPGAFSELRPGCFDIHGAATRRRERCARVDVLPDDGGLQRATFTEAGDKELSSDAAGVQRLHR